jgi:hypothetical protein
MEVNGHIHTAANFPWGGESLISTGQGGWVTTLNYKFILLNYNITKQVLGMKVKEFCLEFLGNFVILLRIDHRLLMYRFTN